MNQTCLHTKNLAIGYHSRVNKKPIASNLNLSLQTGKLTCLIGPNGVGKSTLLRTLAGLQSVSAGEIWINNKEISTLSLEETAKQISVVLTENSHPGDLKVRQIIELGRLPYTNWLGTLSQQDQQILALAAEQMNIVDLLPRNFFELSDGERQKVFIARALAQEPCIMILDEPTAFLDWPNRVDLLILLKQIAKEEEKAILISSHDLELVLKIADELWLMNNDKEIISGTGAELYHQGLLEETFSSSHLKFLSGEWSQA
jgi:iron complex transport system ATP-binding protein